MVVCITRLRQNDSYLNQALTHDVSPKIGLLRTFPKFETHRYSDGAVASQLICKTASIRLILLAVKKIYAAAVSQAHHASTNNPN